MTGPESGSRRGAAPYHCPFCSETDLWPHEPTGWECRACLRAFTVELLGMVKPHGGGAS